MGKLEGSKTEKNLQAAFIGESQARNKYTYFAKVARKQGYPYIAKIFEESANNEMQHAKMEFKLLHGIGDTQANLKEAIEGETHETITMYPQFAQEAEAEGHVEVAALFRQIAAIEKHHAERYKKLLAMIENDMVENDTIYKRSEAIKWKCTVCGYIHEGIEPPAQCPVCKHAREYYEPESLYF